MAQFDSSSLLSLLHPDITLENLDDLWIECFADLKKGAEGNVDSLTAYADTIKFNAKSIKASGGLQPGIVKTFPIVFHAVVDDMRLISPRESETEMSVDSEGNPVPRSVRFNVVKLLKDINKAFASTGIQFKPILTDIGPDGKGLFQLTHPGLNIIDAKTLYQQRAYAFAAPTYKNITASTAVIKAWSDYHGVSRSHHFYSMHGVAPKEQISAYAGWYGSRRDPLDGITIDYLYQNYAWPTDKVINVFLINDFSSAYERKFKAGNQIKFRPAMHSSNPYVYDLLRLDSAVPYQAGNNFGITVPFWALGNPYRDEDNQGYGYSYKHATASATSITDMNGISSAIINDYLSDSSGVGDNSTIGYYSNMGEPHNAGVATPIIKSLGHLFGLENIVNFIPTFLYTSDQGSPARKNYIFDYNIGCGNLGHYNKDGEQVSLLSAGKTSELYYRINSDPNLTLPVKLQDEPNPIVYTPLDTTEYKRFSHLYGVEYNGIDEFCRHGPKTFMSFSPIQDANEVTFSEGQILQMHANIDLKYRDTETNVVYEGILKQLLNSDVLMQDGDPLSLNSCRPEENYSGLYLSGTAGYALLYDTEVVTYANRYEEFATLKDNIDGIVESAIGIPQSYSNLS